MFIILMIVMPRRIGWDFDKIFVCSPSLYPAAQLSSAQLTESIDDKSVGGWVIAHASQQMSRLHFQLLPLLKKATTGHSAK